MTKKKIFICAGDASGDLHSGRLMRSILELNPNIDFIGIGGPSMEAQGLKSLAKIEDISVVGFWEVAKKYRYFKNLIDKCARLLETEEVDAFVPVDYPGFNLRLAAKAKSLNIPVIYYIAPQLWAWGKNRAKKLVGCIDKLLVVFPFEEEYFKKFGLNTSFVGHPLLDDTAFASDFPSVNQREKLIAFFPGSRKQEILKHSALFTQIAEIIAKRKPDYKFGVALASSLNKSALDNFLPKELNWTVYPKSGELMKTSKVGLVKTGTSNLEACLNGMPFAMAYKTSFITYNMGKRLINLPYISLPNILTDRPIIKEFIQADATPKAIAEHLIYLIDNPGKCEELQNEFRNIKKLLGESGACKNAAKIILDSI